MGSQLKKIEIGLENHIQWRQVSETLKILWLGGDPLVLTVSVNGHDAEALYMPLNKKEFIIKEKSWYTIESLGKSSEVGLIPSHVEEEVAPLNWRPTPRASQKSG